MVSRVLNCQECGNPWGVIGTSDEDRAALRQAVDEWFGDEWVWNCFAGWKINQGPVHGPPPLFSPEITTLEVVFLTESSAHWLSEHIGVDTLCDPPVWQEQCDIPDWWFKPRAKTALRVDCCGLRSLADEALATACRFDLVGASW